MINGLITKLKPKANSNSQKPIMKSLLRLRPYLKAYKRTLMWGVCTVIISNLFVVADAPLYRKCSPIRSNTGLIRVFSIIPTAEGCRIDRRFCVRLPAT